MSTEAAAGVLEGQTFTSDQVFSCDVCIVGSGAGGAVTAALLQRAGLKVIVIEEGGYFTSERFRMIEGEAYPYLYQDGGLRASKDGSMAVLQGKAVGGTTVVNWTTSFRTPARVTDLWRERHAVNHVSAVDLEPHFASIEKRLHIQKIPLEMANRNNRMLYDGCVALGYEADTIPRNVVACVQSGFCGLGCPVDAKQSMLVTYLPDAMHAGATVISRCRVDKLVYQANEAVALEGSFLDATGRTPTGVKVTVKAKRYVMSAGAIGSPGVLLRSATPDPEHRIGVRTFVHPVVVHSAEYAEPINASRGAPQSVASHHFYDRGDEVGFLLEAAPLYPALLATATSGFGREHRKTMDKLPNIAIHLALTGDGFHPDVPGGTVELRADGSPVLDYSVADKTWRALRFAQKELARIALASGAVAVTTLHDPGLVIRSEKDIARIDDMPYAPHKVAVISAHVMGGCGMSDDPKLGVVRSEDLRHHHITNLHVIDGSAFPTSIGVNPQESIYGLAHLTATRLISLWT